MPEERRKEGGELEIIPVVTPNDLAEVKGLFTEYFQWLASELGIDIGYQGLDAELAALPGAYAPPRGCLLLAVAEGRAAGCVALRPLGEGVCELKRMYVRPAHRGEGIGRALGEQIVREAKSRGYTTMRLDTAEPLKAAHRVYTALGFRPTEPYYEAPTELRDIVRFMELRLA
jgi:putative acetyltransferase